MMDQFDPVSPAFTRRDRNSIDLHNSGSTSQHSHHSGPTTNHHSMQQQQQQPTPLQQRMATAEVHRSKKQRKMEQERVYQDLTARLDQECRKTQELESTLEQRERQWLLHFQQLEEDRDAQKRNVDVEKDENKRLRDSLGRKDQEIYRVLQRKFHKNTNPNLGGGGGQRDSPSGSVRDVRQVLLNDGIMLDRPTNSNSNSSNGKRGPWDVFQSANDMESARIRQVTTLMTQFFGLPSSQ